MPRGDVDPIAEIIGDYRAFAAKERDSPDVEPVYVLFEDFTHVKVYRRSIFDVVEDEVGRFEGFSHVDD